MSDMPEIVGVSVPPEERNKGLLRDIPAKMWIQFPDGHTETWDAVIRLSGPIYEVSPE